MKLSLTGPGGRVTIQRVFAVTALAFSVLLLGYALFHSPATPPVMGTLDVNQGVALGTDVKLTRVTTLTNNLGVRCRPPSRLEIVLPLEDLRGLSPWGKGIMEPAAEYLSLELWSVERLQFKCVRELQPGEDWRSVEEQERREARP